ncbi:39S ribosomal protein L51, mitochondrial [Lignoscripta atroalba]|nr:39S ribosomal protein L51, mitochondrial [Lignoscripta atroalba]
MPVRAIRTTSTGRNGVGAFILQCKRLDFHYCDWAGSSKGMNAFLRNLLPRFARSNPSIEIHVSPRPSTHPIIRAHYISPSSISTNHPRIKAICVRNLEKEQVLQKAELLRDASGEKLRRVKGGRVVASQNEGVRGIWSPMHGETKSPLDKMFEKRR